ncbi:MAG: hypothetical protein DRG83_17745 [Deltaproteobacteria bacterium]|nr:MAG: hypothetical protein DRG83_17745 [Deltaproteobacteria bacterium]
MTNHVLEIEGNRLTAQNSLPDKVSTVRQFFEVKMLSKRSKRVEMVVSFLDCFLREFRYEGNTRFHKPLSG